MTDIENSKISFKAELHDYHRHDLILLQSKVLIPEYNPGPFWFFLFFITAFHFLWVDILFRLPPLEQPPGYLLLFFFSHFFLLVRVKPALITFMKYTRSTLFLQVTPLTYVIQINLFLPTLFALLMTIIYSIISPLSLQHIFISVLFLIFMGYIAREIFFLRALFRSERVMSDAPGNLFRFPRSSIKSIKYDDRVDGTFIALLIRIQDSSISLDHTFSLLCIDPDVPLLMKNLFDESHPIERFPLIPTSLDIPRDVALDDPYPPPNSRKSKVFLVSSVDLSPKSIPNLTDVKSKALGTDGDGDGPELSVSSNCQNTIPIIIERESESEPPIDSGYTHISLETETKTQSETGDQTETSNTSVDPNDADVHSTVSNDAQSE